MKKTISVLLTFALILSIIMMWNTVVYAADLNSPAYNSLNIYSKPQCTWYVWGRAKEVTGTSLPNLGDAKDWYANAAKAGYSVGSIPKANSIAVWHDVGSSAIALSGGLGHVTYVESVNGNTMNITEGNFLGTPYHEATLSTNGVRSPGLWQQNVTGYIYLDNKNATVEEVKQAYRDILKREADQSGLDSYVGKYTIDFIRNDLLASTEYKQLQAHKNATVEEVKQAYRDILEREADQSGLDTYVGKYTIDFIRNDLLVSTEYKQLQAHKLAISPVPAVPSPEVITPVSVSPSPPSAPTTYTRISGQTRFDTSEAIANKEVNGTITDVIIASGNNFPDALSVSVLAKKLNAPVLLVDSTVDNSGAAFDFIQKNVHPTATVHIIGGTGVISSNFEAKLNSLGFNNIDRIGGLDRYNTDVLVANKLAVAKGTPVIIASGTSFPDALSISSIAATKGYPILLTDRDSLSQDVLDFLTSDQPSKVYVVGGTAVISDAVQSAIQSLLTSPAPDAVTRIAGADRFETNSKILSQFSLSPKNVYVASGLGFPDALAGSAFAASTGDPIILIDPTASGLPQSVRTYLNSLYTAGVKPTITVFGGESAVPDNDLSIISSILAGKN